uniref:CASP-like protein n=1 Tax=Setaria italica TaxID=4555 RepID=K3XRU6_SETIT
MTEMAGRPGTSGGLVLWACQFVFAATCICAMSSAPGFTNYTAFCLFIVGDWVTAILSFAAACSAGVAYFCRRDPQLPCGRFEVATAFAFLSCACSAASALVVFWLLASL